MNTKNKQNFITRNVSFLAFQSSLFLIRFLRRFSKPHFERMRSVFAPEKGGLDPHRNLGAAPKSNNQKWLEILDSKGSSSDSSSRKNTPISLPIWAREIKPFLANQLSEHTRRAYESDLKNFFTFLEGRISPASFSELRPEHIILYRKFLEEGRLTGSPMAKSTINRKLAVVKSFLNWLKLNHLLKENPALLVKGYPQTQESSLKGFSDEEVLKILLLPRPNKAAGSLHAAILHVLLYMGLRRSELLGLRLGDLDTVRGVRVLKVRGKGHRVRILPLTDRVHTAIENYLFVNRRDKANVEEPLFVPTKNNRTFLFNKQMNPHSITYIVTHYAKKAGVLKKTSPHSCRATCISNALDRRATQRSVQHLAGWSTPLMIQRYDKRKEDLENSAAYYVNYEAPSENRTASPS